MKILLIVSFLCAQAYCISNSCFDFGKERIDFEVLQNAVERRCAANGNNDQQFSQSISNFERCMYRSMENSTTRSHAVDNSKTLCSFLQESHFDICLNNFTTDILPCLGEDEIYIQKLLLDAYYFGYEELCGINGASNFQHLYDKLNGGRLDCILTCGQLFVRYGLCTGNLNLFKQLDKGVLNLNKHDVCRDLESFQKCTTEVLEGVCNEEFSRFTNLVVRPLLVDCVELNARK